MSEELKEWYNTVPYEEIKNIIRDRMSVMAREYVGIGFYLRRVRDNEMYLEDGYKDVHEFAATEFGMSRSTVNHCMRINEQFSVGGNSPTIDGRYKDFNKSQLQEMLYLTEDKLDEVTPDMTIKEIRGLKADRLDVEPETDDQIPGQMGIEDYPECMPENESGTNGSDQNVNLRKPTQEEKNILAAFARKLIRDNRQYFVEDFARRVTDVTTSGALLYQHLGFHRTWYFKDLEDHLYHINLFEGYIQLWSESGLESGCIGDFDWFYLMAQVQSQWNIVAMEEADKQLREQSEQAELPDDESDPDKQIESKQDPEGRCITGKAKYGTCGAAAYCGENASCCLECDNDCNSRCGWLEDEVAEADSETDNNVNIDMGNVVDQQEFATEADENVIDAECLEVTEEQPKRSDTILTYLVEACIEEFELDDLFAESGDADIFREDASFEMSGMSVRFRIGDDEFRADFNDDISIRDAKTEKELDITFRWDQFFEKLERIGDIGEKYAAENAEIVEVGCDNSSDLDDIPFSRVAIRDYLEEEERTLAEYEEVNSKDGGLPLNLMMRQRMLVKALRLLMQNETVPEEDDEPEEQEEPKTVQPEMPILKNNDQRKAFLDNYQTWPIWFEVPEASEVYHRFDLPDGSSIVICEYHLYLEWKKRYADENPNSIASREYLLKPGYHYLHDCLSNKTALVEHLKEVQKK